MTRHYTLGFFAAGLVCIAAPPAAADEGGVSFWLPGQYGSFAAAPADAGWSLPLIYYHTHTDAGASQAFPSGGMIRVGMNVRADLLLAVPTYVFQKPVAGGQVSVSVAGMAGSATVGVDATLTRPGADAGTATGRQSDSLIGFGDLFPSVSLRWTRGAHNYMTYAMAGIPVGAYDSSRLANLGANHWSLDSGGAYTYLDPESGQEISATLGFTYNFENPDTSYRNGVSAHLDWAASHYLSEHAHLGAVGYFYEQLGSDSGAGANLGDFKSSVYAAGPQVGYFFGNGSTKWYLNIKGYYEFHSRNRPAGWNAWATLVVPLSGG